jgi:O-methyltransferase domain/Dimerisation domain
MSSTATSDASVDFSPVILLEMLAGAWVARAIQTAVELDLADLLDEGPRTADQIASATATDPLSMYRLLRALASVGVFEEGTGRLFSQTPLSACLASTHPGSVKEVARAWGQKAEWAAWGALPESIRTGTAGFVLTHGKTAWAHMAEEPAAGRLFDDAVAQLTQLIDSPIVSGYDFSGFRSLVDVGGGTGTLLRDILSVQPELRGTLMDLPPVVAGLPTDLGFEAVPGNFFEAVPAGADAYLLKSILHDWDDEHAVAILRTVRAAIPPHGRLLVVEQVLPELGVDKTAAFSDLLMFAILGGRERTRQEFEELLGAAGFAMAGVVPTDGLLSVIEARPL